MGVAELREAVATAAREDDGTPARRQHRLDVACELIVALVDELADDEADRTIAQTIALCGGDARLEIAVRRRLARELASYERFRAVVQLSAAIECAHALGLPDLEAELSDELGRVMRDDDGTRTLRTTSSALAAASRTANPELAARMQLSLSLGETGAVAEQHARASFELASASGDVGLLHDTAARLAELLIARGALAEAEALIVAGVPRHRDDARLLRLLDDLRARAGR